MPTYHTDAGPERGPILWQDTASPIDVIEDGGLLPVGQATPLAWDDSRRALYRLTVRGALLPGLWRVQDRAFVRVDLDGGNGPDRPVQAERAGASPMAYRTDAVGPERGPLLYRELPGVAIGVMADPPPSDLSPGMPIGIAQPAGWDDRGRALYRLTVKGERLPGRWLVIDRRFIEAVVDG
jgi:hypothetical protein